MPSVDGLYVFAVLSLWAAAHRSLLYRICPSRPHTAGSVPAWVAVGSGLLEFDDLWGSADVSVASGCTGEHDDLALLACGCDGGTHGLESLWVAPPEGVIDHDGGSAIVGADDGCTCESADDAELFACAGAELADIKGSAVECAA